MPNHLYPPHKRPFEWLMIPLISLVIAFGGGWLGAAYYHEHSTTAGKQYIDSESQLIAKIAKDVGASVVSIDVTTESATPDFFGFAQPAQQQAAGTGVIISSDGIIMTNRHVVPAGTQTVNVTLADGTRYTNVKVLGRTSDNSSLDIAFIQIPDLKGHKLTVAKLGNSTQMQVGDKVVAIGNALGQFQNTVTSGIISGYGRELTAGDESGASTENLTDLFQTDAAINAGNSGGPLVNLSGEVIGINTAVAGGANNIGFAIPVNDTKGLIAGVLKQGKVQQPYVGIHYVSVTADVANQYKLPVDNGAFIVPSSSGQSSVVPGSPADKAGLKPKDVITKVNDITIDDRTSLTTALAQFQPGDNITLTIIRGGKNMTVQLTLGTVPNS